MVAQVDSFTHPVFIHVCVLIPNLLLRNGARDSARLKDVQIVRVQLNWVGESAKLGICGVLQQTNVSELDDKLLHVIVLYPQLVCVGFRHFTFQAFYLFNQ